MLTEREFNPNGHLDILVDIPWFVTGRLDAAAAARLTSHIQECGQCRAEVGAQRELHVKIRTAPALEIAPQASFAKLLTRIAELERELPRVGNASGQSPTAPGAYGLTKRSVLRPLLFAQSAALIVLTLAVGFIAVEHWAAPRFATATSAASPQVPGTALRVVVALGVSIGDFEQLLRKQGARVIDGPTPEHAWTIELPATLQGPVLQRALEQLQQDPRVQLAQPLPSSYLQ